MVQITPIDPNVGRAPVTHVVPETPKEFLPPAPARKTAEDYEAELVADYSQWVAVVPIMYEGARAYNIGDPVPNTNVILHGYDEDGLVERVK